MVAELSDRNNLGRKLPLRQKELTYLPKDDFASNNHQPTINAAILTGFF